MSALDTLPDSQSSKVGKTQKSEFVVSRRKSPNQRKYEDVRSRELFVTRRSGRDDESHQKV
ncbi:hypothetical protein [Nostoc sp.]|uniref:hypothetical protein n=1 Tax=Nostoc sp. TaxID=1180 RepID=UPI002FFB01D5